MNKNEAEKKVKEWEEDRVEIFCPLTIVLYCECLNRMKAETVFEDGKNYHTFGGYCTCHCLNGNNC